MKKYLGSIILSLSLFLVGSFTSCTSTKDDSIVQNQLLVRMAEVEVDQAYLSEYLAILNDEARESMAKEAGVVAIFPMQLQNKPTSIRILEIYKDQASYEAHLGSQHFLFYKESTKEMVKGLKLVEHKVVDAAAMSSIFRKIN